MYDKHAYIINMCILAHKQSIQTAFIMFFIVSFINIITFDEPPYNKRVRYILNWIFNRLYILDTIFCYGAYIIP